MGDFEMLHEQWIAEQTVLRNGESLRRLREGHGHAERIFAQLWWQAVGHFDFLSAEMEVYDFRDGVRYLDFAYLRPPHRICIEVDAYGTHCRNLSRRDFNDERARQNHLMMDDWKVFRFVYDEMNEKPRQVQQTIQQMIGRWYGGEANSVIDLPLYKREIVRMLMYNTNSITPNDVRERIGVSDRYARTLLQQMVIDGLLLPASGKQRVRSYRLNPSAANHHMA